MRHSIRWTAPKIKKRLEEITLLVYRQGELIPPFSYLELSGPMEFDWQAEIDASIWNEISYHSYWGFPRTNFILSTTFKIPTGWKEKGPVALFLPIGIAGDFSHPEALVLVDGQPYAACDRHHQEILLSKEWIDGKSHSLLLHGWTGVGGSTVGYPNKKLQMEPCKVVQIDQPTRDLVALTRVALGIAEHLDANNPAHHHLMTVLDEAYRGLDLRLPIGTAFYESVPEVYKTLRMGIDQAGPPMSVDITAVGHAHIDVAWLWILGQTRQKAGRTFHNVIRLMEQFPEFQFTQSQPQLYAFVQEDFPELFEAIKKRIRDQRWEPIGGMWVEADCNLSGPESLVRQFLLGRSYFRKNFGEGAESPVLWLPDVFGYAWNLPQLIKEAGMDYFFTIKIGWSQYNRLPYDSFWWQGLDGTKILTHFSTTKNPKSAHASTYNSDASPGQTVGTWFNFQQKDYGPPGSTPRLLMSYGWGDGGGGPTREMLENIRLMSRFPSAPRIHTGSAHEFFKKLDQESGEYLPTWNGELYLEYHRGTYTTQASMKRANRKSEFLLHDAEFLAVFADLMDGKGEYPAEKFNTAWKLICLNQFHDIIPGSSIGPVYKEAQEQYQQINTVGEAERQKALGRIHDKLGGDFLLVNPTSFSQDQLVLLPDEMEGTVSIKGQPVREGTLVRIGEIPAYSATPFEIESLADTMGENIEPVVATTNLLENAYLRVEFNQEGDITRIYDKKAVRDVLLDGMIADQFQAFEDRPLSWDAWDIDIFYDDKLWLADPASSIKVIENGPLRGMVKIARQILNSEYVQIISLDFHSPQINFKTRIDWQERKILLKTSFPVDILSSTATYEIQWGNVERPTHYNTSWDWARFETAAQKWVDLSEGGYGISLLNDCKYGHDIHENVIRLTLLRGTTAPDPDADLGIHEFAYSLYPHEDRWDEKTVSAAYVLNDPLIVYLPKEKKPIKDISLGSLVNVNKPNIIIETVKKAENGEGIIVRLYESQRKRGTFILSTAFPIAEVWRTNLIEDNKLRVTPLSQHELALDIRPYQIITVRLIPYEMGLPNE
jgi:alpha-mannosidase